MKLQVLQENLARGLTIASRFVSPKAQLPILANTLLSAKKNKLTLLATNLETSVAIGVGAKVDKEGEVAVPARTITDLVTNLSPGQLSLSVTKEQLEIAKEDFSSKVAGINASDFPKIPQDVGKTAVALPKDFKEALSKLIFAASVDETRPVLTGILFIFDSTLSLVATDGFRLSKVDIKTKSSQKKAQIILPKNTLAELSRLVGEEAIKMQIKGSENQVVFGVDKIVLSSRVIEGSFPDWQKIIPKSSSLKVLVDREELARAVKLASVFARESANIVKLLVGKKGIEVTASSQRSGQQRTKVDAKVEGEGIEISYNYRFIEEFLNSVDGEEISMEFNDSKSPGVFTDPKNKNYLHLIMPVRVQE